MGNVRSSFAVFASSAIFNLQRILFAVIGSLLVALISGSPCSRFGKTEYHLRIGG